MRGLRTQILERRDWNEKYFRWRGASVSRLEGLTDAVFAISLTLLVVTLEVPRSYAELRAAFVQIPVFLACFAILFGAWYSHYLFHRRFGLEDGITVVLNALFLFVILFYVYPLKFMFRTLYSLLLYGGPWQLDPTGKPIPDADGSGLLVAAERPEMAWLMLWFGAGYAAIYLTFFLSNLNAWRLRKRLGLGRTERAVTRASMRGHVIQILFGLNAVLLVLIEPDWARYAGLSFFLLGPAMFCQGYFSGRSIERVFAEERSEAAGERP